MRHWGLPVVIGIALVIAAVLVVRAAPTVLFEEPSGDGVIRVVERPDGLRELYLSAEGARQTALYPRFPRRLVLDYTRVAAVGPALVSPGARVLYVGLGGGAMPTWLRQVRNDTPIDVVEIDSTVVAVARDYFGFREDPAMRVWIADGRPFIEEAPAGFWGLIVLDAFGTDGVPRALTTVEFLEAVRSALAADGVVVSNVHAAGPEYPEVVAGYRDVFDRVVLLEVPGRAQRIVVAADSARSLDRESVLSAARRFTADAEPGFDLAELLEEAWVGPPRSDAAPRRDAPAPAGP
jgi:spermidine synthase